MSRLPQFEASERLLATVAAVLSAMGIVWHVVVLAGLTMLPTGLSLPLNYIVSMIGIQLAVIGLAGSFVPALRGLAGGLLILASSTALFTRYADAAVVELSWQLRAHILLSIFAYGLLAVGAIVAVFTLVQDNRLRSGKISSVNRLFAPLEVNERLLYGIAAAGFTSLLLGVVSGLTFVDNLFAQHLAHKSALSILALLLFGLLLGGRYFAGWRGRRAVFLYLWGFAVLCLAYFGSRVILEHILGRSWG